MIGEHERWHIDDQPEMKSLTWKIWADDDELEQFGKSWMELLGWFGHGKNCCYTATCFADLAFEAIRDTTMRELDKLGLLRKWEDRVTDA